MSCDKETKTNSPFKRVTEQHPPQDELVLFRFYEEDGRTSFCIGKNPKFTIDSVEEKNRYLPAITTQKECLWIEITLSNGAKKTLSHQYDLEWIPLPLIWEKDSCTNCSRAAKKSNSPWKSFADHAPNSNGLHVIVQYCTEGWYFMMAKKLRQYISDGDPWTHTIHYIDQYGDDEVRGIKGDQTWWVKLPEE